MRNNRIGYGEKSKDINLQIRDLRYGPALVPRQLLLP